MTRFERTLLQMGPIQWPEDVAKLKEALPALNFLTNYQIQELYGSFSEEQYCAGWLVLDENTIKEFEEYLNEEV